jgi:hypothetical protein
MNSFSPVTRFGVCNALENMPQNNKSCTYEDMHLVEHIVRTDEIMSDAYPVGLHGVPQAVRVRADIV